MKKMILLAVMLTLVAFVSGAMAQVKPAPAKPATTAAPAPAKPEAPAKIEKFSGTIDNVDAMGKAIVVKGKVKKEEKMMTFSVDDKTKITKGKASLSFADLKKDMHVKVEYKKDGDKMTAVSIQASAPKAAPKKKEEPKK